MIKTILVPATGSETDVPVFASALAVARPFAAHLDFLHVQVDAAAMVISMASEGGGAAMVGGLIEQIETEASQREEKAKQLFQSFCERQQLALADAPTDRPGLSAQWHREIGVERYWFTEYARTADLVVVGRPAEAEGAALDTIEAALIEGGRPVFIPPAPPLATLPETIVIAWKSTPEAARAVTAAMPFLAIAKQVQILTVAEEADASDEEAARLVASLRWHGFQASARQLQPDTQGAAETLLTAAGEQAALVVMGAYGHSRLREWMFGGFTRHVLRDAKVPVLLAH